MDAFLHELEPPPTSNCVSCTVDFTKVSGAVSEIHIFGSNNEFERSVSLLEALSAIFTSRNLLKAQQHNYRVVMCPKCAEVVSNMYRDYLNLLQLSTASGYICRLVSQIHTWHQFHQVEQAQLLVENDDGDFSPAVYALDDDDDDGDEDYQPTQITVTDFFNLGSDEGGASTITLAVGDVPGAASPSKCGKSSVKGKRAALKERYRIKAATAQKKHKKPKPALPEGVLPKKKAYPSRYQCRFINKRQFVTCKSCPESFLYNWKLHEHHFGTHDGKIRDECASCGFQYFPEVIKPETHVCLTDMHRFPKSRKKPVLCEICGERFRVERMLQFHQEKVHVQDSIKFKCIQCSKLIASRNKLVMHMETHNPDKKYLCTTCGMAFSQFRGLDKHRLTHNEPSIPCEVCGKMVKTKDSLTAHLKTHSVAKDPETGDPKEPKVSVPKEKPEASGPMSCEVCNKEFKSKRNMVEHYKYMHTGEKYFKHICPVCDKREYTSSKLKRHMRNHLSAQERKTFLSRDPQPCDATVAGGPYTCKWCGKQYVYKNYLLDHIKLIHEPELAAVKCSICERPFMDNRSVELHEKSHLSQEERAAVPKTPKAEEIGIFEGSDSAFPCPDCDKVFKSKRRVVDHHRYQHSNLSIKTCSLCEKQFRSKSHWIRHMRTHSKKPTRRSTRKRKKTSDSNPDFDDGMRFETEQSCLEDIKPIIVSSPGPSKCPRRSQARESPVIKSKPCPKSKKKHSELLPTSRTRARQVRRPVRYQSDSEYEAEIIIPDPIVKPKPRAKREAVGVGGGSRPSRSMAPDASNLRTLEVALERDRDIEAAVVAGERALRSSARRAMKIDPAEEPEPEMDDDDPLFVLGD